MKSDESGDWVRVESESELRAGMTVEMRPCGFCGKTERVMLMRSLAPSPMTRTEFGMAPSFSREAWKLAGYCMGVPAQFDRAIREGRLYRYQLPPEATDDAEAVTRERELAR